MLLQDQREERGSGAGWRAIGLIRSQKGSGDMRDSNLRREKPNFRFVDLHSQGAHSKPGSVRLGVVDFDLRAPFPPAAYDIHEIGIFGKLSRERFHVVGIPRILQGSHGPADRNLIRIRAARLHSDFRNSIIAS
jgi:hypothetical protein